MPTEHSVRLHDHQHLPPRAQLVGQKNKQHSVELSQCWAFDLSPQNDELLAQESILQYQFRFAAREVCDNIEEQGMIAGLGISTKAPVDSLTKRV